MGGRLGEEAPGRVAVERGVGPDDTPDVEAFTANALGNLKADNKKEMLCRVPALIGYQSFSKYFLLCSVGERKSLRFEMIIG